MQFGRFHGIALLTLGLLLLVVQTYVFFGREVSQGAAPAIQGNPEQTAPDNLNPRMFEYVPGIAGLVFAGAGVFVIVQRQRQILKNFEASQRQDSESSPELEKHA